jgi:hypothetical protein
LIGSRRVAASDRPCLDSVESKSSGRVSVVTRGCSTGYFATLFVG